MTLHNTLYIVVIKGFERVFKFKKIEDAFELIKRFMPCEASIKAIEE